MTPGSEATPEEGFKAEWRREIENAKFQGEVIGLLKAILTRLESIDEGVSLD